VLIEDSTGNFIEDTSVCNGADATTLANLFCLVPMTTFWASPYSRVQADPVKAKIIAINERGSSATSPENTDLVQVETVPQQMAAPTEGSDTSNLQIQVVWSALSAP